jgi:hypothetical protein
MARRVVVAPGAGRGGHGDGVPGDRLGESVVGDVTVMSAHDVEPSFVLLDLVLDFDCS